VLLPYLKPTPLFVIKIDAPQKILIAYSRKLEDITAIV
jgi:hypothetical protein